jgi:hypothetical protein
MLLSALFQAPDTAKTALHDSGTIRTRSVHL